ncbi:bifunctional chorismate mutase/prephenate dehydrogenase [Wenzhouxiangella sp. XN79A]|uniref:bifunctional chorismate mutase/prephenate dehydrogenase n=1 Tax=Wenzhouxiangella sp. XN79A TaxID=2724193 RepID=UPI00144AB696|nr:bifunctional chorismate mutase/prephenate dehydrogenase [Wenzhouxiangella sp. XN79A]NKI35993.1 bifunctional chorismate mutase/prephenate dehydrogenase [Wenzhouxiangella sp. XN79A]
MTDAKEPELDRLRAELDRIDRALIERAAERQRVVSEIGRIKKSAGRALRDFRRERQVLDGVRARAVEVGLDPDLAETLLTALIEASLTRQEAERVAGSGRGSGRSAVVVGGLGRMGDWMTRFLAEQGWRVIVADPAVETPGDDAVRVLEDAPASAELIVLAAPIQASADRLDELIERGSDALVLDLASVKGPLIEPLKRAAGAGLQVASIHPMFGPDTRLLAGRHVLFMDCGRRDAVDAARALFADTMAECVDVPLDAHDGLMAWVLGLSHAINLVFADAVAGSGRSPDELAEVASTTFGRQLAIARDVTRENPALYFEIQRLNPAQADVLEALRAAVEQLIAAVDRGDAEAFAERMIAAGDWVEGHRRARRRRTHPEDMQS